MAHRLALTQTVTESMIHIIEPVALQSVRYMLCKLNINHLMEEVHLVSDFRETSNTLDKNNRPKLFDYRCTARLTPSVNPYNLKWMGNKNTVDLGNGNVLIRHSDLKTYKRGWTPTDFTDREYSVFHDPDTYIDIQQWDVGSSFTLEIKLDFHDLTPAQLCLSEIFATFANGEMYGYVPIQYDFPMPRAIQAAMKYLYTLTDFEQTNEAYHSWLAAKSAGQISWNLNRNDLRTYEMVGLRNNAMALYQLECTQDAPEVKENGYTINCNMTVQFSRTNRVTMMYPIVVNQHEVTWKMIPMEKDVREVNNGAIMWQNRAVDAWWKQNFKDDPKGCVHYPWWDKWTPQSGTRMLRNNYVPFFIAAFTLDDPDNEQGVTKINLKNGLPGYKLNDTVLRILRDEQSTCLEPSNCYFHISVFAHDFPVSKALLDFDGETLTIMSRRKTSIYRLVISYRADPINHIDVKNAFELIDEVNAYNEAVKDDESKTLKDTKFKSYQIGGDASARTFVATITATKKQG